MRRWLKKTPALYRLLRKVRDAYRRATGSYVLRQQLLSTAHPKIVIGSAGVHDPGWIPTEHTFLDLLRPEDWERFFRSDSIDALLAEHVWEHLTLEEGLVAARICFQYLKPGGYIRVAVPDGFHPSPRYIERVKIAGIGPGADDHKMLYTYKTLKGVFERAGFEVVLYEYFDEAGRFHYRAWDPQGGTIWRSVRFDKRNEGGVLGYTSIVLDARKARSSP
jgi:predicted SAM-dependent methyltransferase